MALPFEDELANDPLARGYTGMTDSQLIASLNAEDRSQNRTSMTGREVKSHIDATEFAGKTNAQKQQVIELIKRNDLDLFGLDEDILVDIFAGDSATATALSAARKESISRAAELGLPEITPRYLRLHTVSRKVPS
jgi:hypothetical protein